MDHSTCPANAASACVVILFATSVYSVLYCGAYIHMDFFFVTGRFSNKLTDDNISRPKGVLSIFVNLF
jgi:hypothetical protein